MNFTFPFDSLSHIRHIYAAHITCWSFPYFSQNFPFKTIRVNPAGYCIFSLSKSRTLSISLFSSFPAIKCSLFLVLEQIAY